MSETAAGSGVASPPTGDGPDAHRVRHLFRYLGGEEWAEYRAILAVFADTFFTEFSPEEVQARMVDSHLGADVVRDRLERLRQWGNLTVSTDAGNPTSLEDYNRRRHRYLITSAGQQVFDLTERLLAGIDEVADPQAGRLSDLAARLQALADHASSDFGDLGIEDATAAVRAVFDTHERFAEELTGFFRQLAQWQSRYDLSTDEVQLLATVIVGYVSEQLAQIERLQRPIARSLELITPRLDRLLPRVDAGLAERVGEAGLAEMFSARRTLGTERDDWRLLSGWFSEAPGRPSRLSQLTDQALSAVRTLTANLSRLSRLGTATTSRRADFLRLAGSFDAAATSGEAHDLAAAAFGLGSCRKAGTLAADADDPAPTTTPWASAPRASVPVSLRERGERTQRGNTTPVRDRSSELRIIAERLDRERVERQAAARELLSGTDETGRIDGALLSPSAFGLLRELISLCGHHAAGDAGTRVASAAGLRCELRRDDLVETVIRCPEGRLLLHGLTITIAQPDGGERRAVQSAAATSAPTGAEAAA
ncbi:TIGR02677 family protein [Candidatus Poriferisodalis sp.]|uniref:TIGR02677 family protein n=1 Tax=Candidatus Poriferisodalis sp. TaxID=3101277 RepID=UPI003B015E27